MKRSTFYICAHCGNIVMKVADGGVPVMCCGEEMKELVPNTTEAATEKHIPVANCANGHVEVTVGSVEHPMDPDHYIEWIYLVTKKGSQSVCLEPGDAPKADFNIGGDTPLMVFAYCNKHGLWKADL